MARKGKEPDQSAADAEADVEEMLAGMAGAEVSKGGARSSVQVGADGRAVAKVTATPPRPLLADPPAVTARSPATSEATVPSGLTTREESQSYEEARREAPAPPLQVASRKHGRMSLTAEFLTLAISDPWDRSFEKLRPGAFGGAFLAAPMLELLLAGRLKVQRDRFQVTEGPALAKSLEDLAAALDAHRDFPSLDAMRRIGRNELPDLVLPWKLRLQEAGILVLDAKGRVVQVADPDAQGALENRLTRILAGSGVVQAQDIVLLGLAQASGVLPRFVPQSALAFNEKRIKALLSGRDTLDYRVDSGLRNVQELALSTILAHVRTLMAP